MQPVFGLGEFEEKFTAHTLGAKRHPLGNNLFDTHHARRTGNEDIEVAGKTVLQRCTAEEFFHQLLGIYAFFQVDGDLQAVQVGFIANVIDFGNLLGLVNR